MKIINRVYSNVFESDEVDQLLTLIEGKKVNQGFGIRYFLRDNPAVLEIVKKNQNFKRLLSQYFKKPVILKTIYFDKPPSSNWTVNWHQDITLNLKPDSAPIKGKNMRILADRIVIQSQVEILENILTFRIHFDDTDATNGALSIIENSEAEGVVRIDKEYVDEHKSFVKTCIVRRGGVMLMNPLTIHSSRRTSNTVLRRRVLHLEVAESSVIDDIPLLEYYEI